MYSRRWQQSRLRTCITGAPYPIVILDRCNSSVCHITFFVWCVWVSECDCLSVAADCTSQRLVWIKNYTQFSDSDLCRQLSVYRTNSTDCHCAWSYGAEILCVEEFFCVLCARCHLHTDEVFLFLFIFYVWILISFLLSAIPTQIYIYDRYRNKCGRFHFCDNFNVLHMPIVCDALASQPKVTQSNKVECSLWFANRTCVVQLCVHCSHIFRFIYSAIRGCNIYLFVIRTVTVQKI